MLEKYAYFCLHCVNLLYCDLAIETLSDNSNQPATIFLTCKSAEYTSLLLFCYIKLSLCEHYFEHVVNACYRLSILPIYKIYSPLKIIPAFS